MNLLVILSLIGGAIGVFFGYSPEVGAAKVASNPGRE